MTRSLSRSIFLGILTTCGVLIAAASNAQPGANDPTFNPDDRGFGNGEGKNRVLDVAMQPDGKMIIVGAFDTFNGKPVKNIARVDHVGRVDTSFHAPTGFDQGVRTVAIQSDGRILIGGDFSQMNGAARVGVVRLNMDGSEDTTFLAVVPGYYYPRIHDIAVLPNNTILVSGYFTNYLGYSRNCIVRLFSNGALDPFFGSSVGAGAGQEGLTDISAIAVQPDGRILLAGNFGSYEGSTRSGLARAMPDGSLDTTFHYGSGCGGAFLANHRATAVSLQVDGKILLGGEFTLYNDQTHRGLVRLLANGDIDPTFVTGTGLVEGGTGGPDNYFVGGAKPLANGDILVVGRFVGYNGTAVDGIARIDPSGGLVAGFDARAYNSMIYTAYELNDGRIVLAGTIYRINNIGRVGIGRVFADGSLDHTYNDFGTGANGVVHAIEVATDGKIIIGGEFTGYNGSPMNNVARLLPDGPIDTTFQIGGGSEWTVYDVSAGPDGSVAVGGWFHKFAGDSIEHTVRLDSSGSLDPGFNSGTGPNYAVYATLARPDGKVLVGGYFTQIDGVAKHRIAQFNPDGSLDTDFNPTSTTINGSSGPVHCLGIQSDGKILAAGFFTSYNQTSARYIARLFPDGTRDTTFAPSLTLNDEVNAIAVQSDGKIIAAGSFTSMGRIFRLNTDGSMDSSFVVGSGANNEVHALALDAFGNILVGGRFTSFNGQPRSKLVRLFPDGSVDGTFQVGDGFNGDVDALAVDPHGKLLVAGNFTEYDGIGRDRIARLFLKCLVADNSCDDMDPCTVNDLYDPDCNCVGTVVEPGSPCDDGDPLTIDDVVDEDCICLGTLDPEMGIAPDRSGSVMQIYPNPNDGSRMYIQMDGPFNGPIFHVDVLDGRGTLVHSETSPRMFGGKGFLVMPHTALSAGPYLVRISTDHTTVVGRLMVL